MTISPDTVCNVCEYTAECWYADQPMCYLCRENSAKAKREQAALLAVIREAGGYADREQAEYYSTPSPRREYSRGPDSCEDYWKLCRCKACMTRERWLDTGR